MKLIMHLGFFGFEVSFYAYFDYRGDEAISVNRYIWCSVELAKNAILRNAYLKVVIIGKSSIWRVAQHFLLITYFFPRLSQ